MIYELDSTYYVRSPQDRDLEGPYPSWFEDQEVCRFNSHGKFFKNLRYFQEYLSGLNGDDKVVWAICHVSDGHIGNISLQEISRIDRNAEFAILLGDKRHWGKGVGILAGNALLRHAFDKVNLERVYCGTAATNIGMRKLAERLGMVQEGCRRQQLYLDGEWVDVVEYGILRREFQTTASQRTRP